MRLFIVVIVLPLAAVVGVLWLAGAFVDRGACLRSHPSQYWQPDYMLTCDGKGSCQQQLIGGHMVDTVDCDQWEFPQGRPQEASR